MELEVLTHAFGDACEKLREGHAKYGDKAFLKRDTVQDIKDELLDAINYLCFLYYKMGMIEEVLDASGVDPSRTTVEEVRDTD